MSRPRTFDDLVNGVGSLSISPVTTSYSFFDNGHQTSATSQAPSYAQQYVTPRSAGQGGGPIADGDQHVSNSGVDYHQIEAARQAPVVRQLFPDEYGHVAAGPDGWIGGGTPSPTSPWGYADWPVSAVASPQAYIHYTRSPSPYMSPGQTRSSMQPTHSSWSGQSQPQEVPHNFTEIWGNWSPTPPTSPQPRSFSPGAGHVHGSQSGWPIQEGMGHGRTGWYGGSPRNVSNRGRSYTPRVHHPPSVDLPPLRLKRVECEYCKNMHLHPEEWRSHNLRNKVTGRVQCPMLRALPPCQFCGAVGDNAHVPRKCPNQPAAQPQPIDGGGVAYSFPIDKWQG